MQSDVTINVARDFATHPMGREAHLWPFSGERFRKDYLLPPLLRKETVTVDLRGTRGLAPSFLEESFGGLIEAGLSYSDIDRQLTIVTDDGARARQIWKYIRQAAGIATED